MHLRAPRLRKAYLSNVVTLSTEAGAMTTEKHSVGTVAAVACIAFVIADLSHEVLGHGVMAYLLGAQHLRLSSTYLNSDINSKLVQAAGTLANLLEGALAWLLFRRRSRNLHWRYFLWLLIAFNLLDGTGYFLFSAVSNSGDWAEIIKSLPYTNAVRIAMGMVGAAGYFLSARLCAYALIPFSEKLEDLTLLPYWIVLVVNCAAAALNPLGIRYVLISALPATAGANAALVMIPRWTRRLQAGNEPKLLISRNRGLVAVGVLVVAVFVFVIGRGISWSRY
jgi:hypothetical protein